MHVAAQRKTLSVIDALCDPALLGACNSLPSTGEHEQRNEQSAAHLELWTGQEFRMPFDGDWFHGSGNFTFVTLRR